MPPRSPEVLDKSDKKNDFSVCLFKEFATRKNLTIDDSIKKIHPNVMTFEIVTWIVLACIRNSKRGDEL